jgi:hypothetical protein
MTVVRTSVTPLALRLAARMIEYRMKIYSVCKARVRNNRGVVVGVNIVLGLRYRTFQRRGLSPEAKPTLADFIRDLEGDTENLLTLVFVALRNGVEKSALEDAFREAEVDIGAEIVIAERLLAISPRALGLSEAQLDKARDLLVNQY